MKNFVKFSAVALWVISLCNTTLAWGSFWTPESVNRWEDITLRWDVSYLETVKWIYPTRCKWFWSDELYVKTKDSYGNDMHKEWNNMDNLDISSEMYFPTSAKYIGETTKQVTIWIECFDEAWDSVYKTSWDVNIIDEMKIENLDLSSKIEEDWISVSTRINFTWDFPEDTWFYSSSNINSSYCNDWFTIVSPWVATADCKIRMDMDSVKAWTYDLNAKIEWIWSRTTKITIEDNKSKTNTNNSSKLSTKVKDKLDNSVNKLKSKIDSKYGKLESKIKHFEKLNGQLKKLADKNPKYGELVSHLSEKIEEIIEEYRAETEDTETEDDLEDIINLLQ